MEDCPQIVKLHNAAELVNFSTDTITPEYKDFILNKP